MEFQLYERKFKLDGEDLYTFLNRGGSKIERCYKIKLTLIKSGYKTFTFTMKGKQRNLKFHRVVYYAHNPNWNIYDTSKFNKIDHIDRTTTNNHISNLRVVTQQENNFNKTCLGYTFHKRIGKYQSQIQLNGKKIHIGYHDTPDEAREAYLRKKAEVHIIPQRIHN
mgnify:CR=1 FL=1